MAEFIVGNSLRKLAREHRFLQRALWRVDYLLVSLVAWLARRLPIDTASRFGSRVGAWIGPKMKAKNAIYRANLALAFPGLDDSELDTLIAEAWGQAGRVLAEYPHLETILKDNDRIQIEIREPECVVAAPCGSERGLPTEHVDSDVDEETPTFYVDDRVSDGELAIAKFLHEPKTEGSARIHCRNYRVWTSPGPLCGDPREAAGGAFLELGCFKMEKSQPTEYDKQCRNCGVEALMKE